MNTEIDQNITETETYSDFNFVKHNLLFVAACLKTIVIKNQLVKIEVTDLNEGDQGSVYLFGNSMNIDIQNWIIEFRAHGAVYQLQVGRSSRLLRKKTNDDPLFSIDTWIEVSLRIHSDLNIQSDVVIPFGSK